MQCFVCRLNVDFRRHCGCNGIGEQCWMWSLQCIGACLFCVGTMVHMLLNGVDYLDPFAS